MKNLIQIFILVIVIQISHTNIVIEQEAISNDGRFVILEAIEFGKEFNHIDKKEAEQKIVQDAKEIEVKLEAATMLAEGVVDMAETMFQIMGADQTKNFFENFKGLIEEVKIEEEQFLQEIKQKNQIENEKENYNSQQIIEQRNNNNNQQIQINENAQTSKLSQFQNKNDQQKEQQKEQLQLENEKQQINIIQAQQAKNEGIQEGKTEKSQIESQNPERNLQQQEQKQNLGKQLLGDLKEQNFLMKQLKIDNKKREELTFVGIFLVLLVFIFFFYGRFKYRANKNKRNEYNILDKETQLANNQLDEGGQEEDEQEE